METCTALRTGLAPTYIPTMRQMTSYEKSHINTMNELVRNIRIRETAQIKRFKTRESEQSGRDVALLIRSKKEADAIPPREANYVLRAQLYDETSKEIMASLINSAREPIPIQLEATNAAQHAHLYLTQQANSHLSSYSTAIRAENDILQAEKEALQISIVAEKLKEQFEFENSRAVEAELPKQEALKAFYTHQINQVRARTSDMKTQNSKFEAKVNSLTAARDMDESIKLEDQIVYTDHKLQGDAAQASAEKAEADNAALQALINRYNQANSHLRATNALVLAEINTITAERDALKKSAEAMASARDAGKMAADNYEVSWNDMKQNTQRLWLELKNRDFNQYVCAGAVHGTYTPALKAARDAAWTRNKDLIRQCF